MAGRHRWLMLFLGLTLVRGLIYAAVIPPWQSPDETGHFEYAWVIAHLGRIPAPGDISPVFERELLGSLYEWRYGDFVRRPLPEQIPAQISGLSSRIFFVESRTVPVGRFSLSYLWPAVFLLPFRHQDLTFQLYLARLSSVFLNLMITWLAFQTFLVLVPSRSTLTILMTAVVVFLPQHTFINSMAGDGPLAELMACLALYCWVRAFRYGFKVWEVVGVILGTWAGIWCKRTAIFLIPLDIGLSIWWLLRWSRRGRVGRYIACLCGGLVLLAAGMWLWRYSYMGRGAWNALSRLWQVSPDSWNWMDARGLTLGEGLLVTYDSFWANFGWMALPVSERWHGAIMLLSLMALAGWGIRRPEDAVPPWALGMMGGTLFTACVAFVWVALLTEATRYYNFQGRYLLPVLIPYAFLLVGGLERFFPARGRKYGLVLFMLFLMCFDTWCIAGYILPYFYS